MNIDTEISGVIDAMASFKNKPTKVNATLARQSLLVLKKACDASRKHILNETKEQRNKKKNVVVNVELEPTPEPIPEPPAMKKNKTQAKKKATKPL